jgi:hypothetical protein
MESYEVRCRGGNETIHLRWEVLVRIVLGLGRQRRSLLNERLWIAEGSQPISNEIARQKGPTSEAQESHRVFSIISCAGGEIISSNPACCLKAKPTKK